MVGRLAQRLEYDLQILDFLRQYHATLDPRTQNNPIHELIHNTIKAYFMLDEQAGDERVIQCQARLVDDGQSLLDAFPVTDEEFPPMLVLWMIVNEDVASRHGFEVGAATSTRKQQKRFTDKVYRLLADLDESWQLGSQHILMYYLTKWGSYAFIVLTPFFFLGSFLTSTAFLFFTTLILIAIGCCVNYAYLYPEKIRPKFDRYIERTVRQNYELSWRGRFLQFFDASGATMRDLVPVMSSILQQDDRFHSTTTWLAPLVANDLGLTLYSVASAYQR